MACIGPVSYTHLFRRFFVCTSKKTANVATPSLSLIHIYVIAKETVSIDELCEVFGVSKNTIRRDLNDLEARGHIAKVYGGVTAISSTGAILPPPVRSGMNSADKNLIGRLAAGEVSDGDTIFIDSGDVYKRQSDAHAAGLILQNALQQTGCPSVKALAERLDIRLGEIGPQGHLSCSSAKKKPSPRTSRGSKSTTHFSKRSGSI